MVASVRPWDSVDAGSLMYNNGRWVKSELLPKDSQAQIELCLTCPYADDCHDCVARGISKRTDILRRIRRRHKKGSV